MPDCCGRYIDHGDARPAPDAVGADALALHGLRVARIREYLQATWHASQRPSQLDFDAATKWLGLDVKQFQLTGDASGGGRIRRPLSSGGSCRAPA